MPHRAYLSLVLILAVAGGARVVAQRVPSAQPGAAAAGESPQASGLTLHSNAKLVVVDVTVSDKQGHPVHGLTQNDFKVVEDKAPQSIKTFEEHSGLPAVAAKFHAAPKLPPGVFTNEMVAPVNSALNVLLLDTLNTPLQDQMIVRQQLLDYLQKERPGANIAIFGLTTQLIMLQDFTSDPEMLKKAIKAQKNLKGSPLLGEQVSGDDFQMKLSETLQENGASPDSVARAAQFETVQQSYGLQMRAKYTLDAMNLLARYLVGIPGRKNVIWFSGSFPITILPDLSLGFTGGGPTGDDGSAPGRASVAANSFAGVAGAEDEFRETTDLLARSEVAVYPVHAHGLMAASMFSAANGGSNGGTKYTRNPYAFSNDQGAEFSETASINNTMLQLANGTGGEAFMNSNGLSDAVEKAIDRGSNYYTLTYTPRNDHWKGENRSIHVSLEQQGYTLSYRRSYFADDPTVPLGKGSAAGVRERLLLRRLLVRCRWR